MSLLSDEFATDVADVTVAVWESVLSMSPLSAPPVDATESPVSSSVHIVGGWNGAVSLSTTEHLASVIASTMFELPLGDLSTEDVDDAIGEMANMIGGNVKSLLPGPSQLSMPAVTRGGAAPHFPGAEIAERLDFDVAGEPFTVTVLQQDTTRAEEQDS